MLGSNFLQAQETKVLLRLIYSSNLKFIEHLCDELGRIAAGRKRPTARQALIQASQEESKTMP